MTFPRSHNYSFFFFSALRKELLKWVFSFKKWVQIAVNSAAPKTGVVVTDVHYKVVYDKKVRCAGNVEGSKNWPVSPPSCIFVWAITTGKKTPILSYTSLNIKFQYLYGRCTEKHKTYRITYILLNCCLFDSYPLKPLSSHFCLNCIILLLQEITWMWFIIKLVASIFLKKHLFWVTNNAL